MMSVGARPPRNFGIARRFSTSSLVVVVSSSKMTSAKCSVLSRSGGTLWLSLDRTAESVTASIEQTPANTGDPTVRHISGEAPLDNAGKLVSALPETSNLIVDPLDVLEAQEPHSRFRAFMNDLQNHIVNTGSLAIVHCLDGREVPPLRDTTEHFADVVFQLDTTTNGDEVENRLAIPKFRGGRAPTDIIKLNLVEEVSIDTSRDIA